MTRAVPGMTPAPERIPTAAEAETLYRQATAMERSGNVTSAVRIYRRAARAGNGKAAYRLGQIYSCGVPGVGRDYAESLQWLDLARKLGERVPGEPSLKGGPNCRMVGA